MLLILATATSCVSKEEIMPEQSKFHLHIEWAKERLDEMDAILASLERHGRETQTASRAKADQLIADMRKRRLEFQQVVNTQLQAGEAAWLRNRAQLESQWDGFAAEVNKYFEAMGRQVAVQQAVFRDLAAAQQKAWHDAGEKLRGAAIGFAANRRAEVESAVQQMKAEASKAESQLRTLMGAGDESWAALNAALGEARAAFDRAVQTAVTAVKRAAEPGADGKTERQPPR
jgi:hypothetical protein